ncbi:MAG: hypothetical protein LBO72_01060 [Helicobacteraceae bacterium]|jgi:hypothetical protein|nr:hypothetical protein [Helicobacteraceae bacterium]
MLKSAVKALALASALSLPMLAQDEGSILQTSSDQTPIANQTSSDQTQSTASTYEASRETNQTQTEATQLGDILITDVAGGGGGVRYFRKLYNRFPSI